MQAICGITSTSYKYNNLLDLYADMLDSAYCDASAMQRYLGMLGVI